ncbi:hypothetical protein SAY87_031781 [Trapa incisa]|uniref:Peroxidase n=1 Tax=Trapa incisa TaxID=236973 RepID=A0AAN7KRR2_9MYRT|nr:hypothetical protein SAY87_031781 [Trapa incisa]
MKNMKMKIVMPKLWSKWIILVLLISVLVSLWNRSSITESDDDYSSLSPPPPQPPPADASTSFEFLTTRLLQRDSVGQGSNRDHLQYDFYRNTCPDAEEMVRKSMMRIHSQHPEVSAALLRLLFHDCFIEGCDASIFLDDSRGNQSHQIEKDAVPNRTLKGFEKIDMIKEEIESHCPGVVSCADILALATREGIVLAGGPFYPLFTGRRDSVESYFAEAMAEIPRPDDNIRQILRLFHHRGFTERDTVSLLGAHSIGSIGCEFIEGRLHSFLNTGMPDLTMATDFLTEMREKCNNSINSTNGGGVSSMSMKSHSVIRRSSGFTGEEDQLASISSIGGFSSHYYRGLLRGRGLLHSDQQLMADERTARFVRAYVNDDGTTFRRDFARAMMKMSSLGVLTGSEGHIRENCSSLASSFSSS